MSSFRVINATDGDVFLSGSYKIPQGSYITVNVIELLNDSHFQSVLDESLAEGHVTVTYREVSVTSSAQILSYEAEIGSGEAISLWVDPTSGGDGQAGTFEAPVQTVDRALQILEARTPVVTGAVTIYIVRGTNPVREDILMSDYNLTTEGKGSITFEGYLGTAAVAGAVTAVPNTRQITDAGTSPFTAAMERALLTFDGAGDPALGHWRWIHTRVDTDTVTFNRTTTSAAPVATDTFSVYQPVIWTGAAAGAPTVAVRDYGFTNTTGLNVVFKKIRFEYTKLSAILQIGGRLWLENVGVMNSGLTGPTDAVYVNDAVVGGYNFWVNECDTGYSAVGGRHFWVGDFLGEHTSPSSSYEWSFTDCVAKGVNFVDAEIVGAGGLFINDDCATSGLTATGTKGISFGSYCEITDVDGDGAYLVSSPSSFVGATIQANAVGASGSNVYAELSDLKFSGAASDLGDSAGDYNLEMNGGHLLIENASLFDAATAVSNLLLRDVQASITGAADVGDGGGDNLTAINSTVHITSAALFDTATLRGANLFNTDMYITDAADFGDCAGTYNYSHIGGSLNVSAAALFDANTVGDGMYLENVGASISGDIDISGNAVNNLVTINSDLNFAGAVACDGAVAGYGAFIKGGNVILSGVCDFGDCQLDNFRAYDAKVLVEAACRFDASTAGYGFYGSNTSLDVAAAAVFDGNQLSNCILYGGSVIVQGAATFNTSTAGSGLEVWTGSLLIIGAATTANGNAVDGVAIMSGSGHIDGSSGAVQDSNTGSGILFSGSNGQVTAVVQTVNNGTGITIDDISMVHDGGGNTFKDAGAGFIKGASSVWATA